MSQRTTPPFRADQVGSILRTKAIHDARAKHEKGEMTDAQLKAIEDAEIVKVIKKQEDVGLEAITDGEYRRSFWHYDFYGMLDGVDVVKADHGIQFQGMQTQMKVLKVTGKIDFAGVTKFVRDRNRYLGGGPRLPNGVLGRIDGRATTG